MLGKILHPKSKPGFQMKPGNSDLFTRHEPQYMPTHPIFRKLGMAGLLVILACLLAFSVNLILIGRDPSILARAANGSPFTLAWSSNETDTSLSVAWGDYDNDGDLDLAVGNNGQPNRLYRNDGLQGYLPQLSLVWSSNEARFTTSLAWGDFDRDCDLDLAVGNDSQPNQLYRNDEGMLTSNAVWSSIENDATLSIAWGDYDHDADLDLAVGNYGQNRLYHNDNGVLSLASWSPINVDVTAAVAWGDYDNDGDLDLATGNRFQPNRLYRNDDGTLTNNAVWFSTEADDTTSLAWGDVDNDGFLDLAAGNNGQNRLYHNQGGSLISTAAWSSTETDNTRGVAWGDFDNDGDLDLVVGNYSSPNRLYRNDDGNLTTSAAWSSNETDTTTSIGWGDYDNDGDLDLAFVNSNQPNRIYRNDGNTLLPSADWLSSESDASRSIAWGDYDADGDLDLAVGNYNQATKLYRNDDGSLTTSSVWQSQEANKTTSIAWGDFDNDSDLDLAVGNTDQPNKLYRNEGGVLILDWSSFENDDTTSIAWGDYDGDGYLDLAVGNWDESNRLYHNLGGTLDPVAVWSSDETDWTRSVAWGDYDGDGDLDLAVGNHGQPNRLYRNQGGSLTQQAVWSTDETTDTTYSLAWADVDNDGDLDLAAGNALHPNRLYTNQNGVVASTATWSSSETSYTYSIAWGDYDGDGDMDLAAGNNGLPSRLYRNDAGTLTSSAVWSSIGSADTSAIAWGDYDGDGDLDLAAGNEYQQNRIYTNFRDGFTLPGAVPVVSIVRPGANADFYSNPQTYSDLVIPITYTLTHPEHKPVSAIRAWYSPDGGGRWLEAVATSGTRTTDLNSSPTGIEYVFNWDVFASGFFGSSDNVVIRLQAIPGIRNTPDQVPGPYLHGSYASSTNPFRVRGSQVRVFQESANPGNQVPGAMVYQLPAGQAGQAEPITDLTGKPFLTDSQGYLQGRGELGLGDQLVALLPIAATQGYTLYATSAAPNPSGVDMFTVSSSGVQTLTVSTGHSLAVLNLNISLEWDARQDTVFLEELHYSIQRTSELLYDWTNGQVALGQVTLYHDRLHWNDAHVRIYASNHRRPAAVLGGIVDTDVTDPGTPAIVYQPGMIHIGLVWNRYGDPGSSMGEDWPSALAHEIGHFALFMDDDYLGLDENNQLIVVDTCTGTAMADPYRDDYSELKTSEDWLPGCENTLANKTTGRPDWTTLNTFYATLNGANPNPGPSNLPLALLNLIEVAPTEPVQTMADPRFYLKDEGSASLLPGRETRAFLMHPEGDDPTHSLVDLGRPVVDSILATGAQAGDRLCVIELEAQRTGCKTITDPDDQQLTLSINPAWQPEVRVSPVTSSTIEVEVGNLASGLSLSSRLYPNGGEPSEILPLVAFGEVYLGTFNLDEPTSDGYVRIWVNEPDSQQEVVVDFTMGGNPARMRSGYARMRSGYAPAMSSDGQVILYSPILDFPEGEFYTFQAATLLPNPPLWATAIGPAYWLSQSDGAPSLSGTSLNMGYMENDVPAGEENWIKIYRWDETTAEWEYLTTKIDPIMNTAIATIPGPGLYAMMSTIEIPLYGPGWDQFSYPIQVVRPITQALQSIEGMYSTVYWYDSEDTLDNWKVFAPQVPSWVNDLRELKFGEAYWIYLTQSIVLKLKGVEDIQDTLAPSQQTPPATYYGTVIATDSFLPKPDMPVTVWVNGVQCGKGKTQLVNGRVVYTVNVMAVGPETPGCGALGDTVRFDVGEYKILTTTSWNNEFVGYLPLSTRAFLYLPLMNR